MPGGVGRGHSTGCRERWVHGGCTASTGVQGQGVSPGVRGAVKGCGEVTSWGGSIEAATPHREGTSGQGA